MTANAVGPLLGAWTLPRFEKLDDWLQKPHLVSRFVIFSLFLAPLVSGSILGAYRHFLLQGFSFWTVMERRGIADMLGYALFTPLVLVLCSIQLRSVARLRTLSRTILLLVLVAVIAIAVFDQSSFALSFVLASVTLLVTLRLGFSAAVIAVNVISVIATVATMSGHGPFVLGGGAVLSSRIILLQSFLTLSMLAIFSISVIQLERKSFQDKLKAAYEQMEYLATTDPLTGLTNRRRFEEFLEVEWARAYRMGSSVAMLMIDTDDFKLYNDSFGHLAGDDCLTAIAEVTLPMKRRSTDVLARYGGEEFIFLLPINTLASAAVIAEAIRAGVEALYEQEGSLLKRKVTVSIGCAAMVPGPGLFSKMLIEASDRALYRAKENGRNRVELAEPVLAEVGK